MRTDTQPTYRTTVIAIATIILLALIGYVVWSMWVTTEEEPETPTDVVCPTDVQECPDGSYVGRSGNSCEFAACPTTVTPATTTSDLGMTNLRIEDIIFTYPISPATTYVTTAVWPPEIRVRTVPYTCDSLSDDTVMSERSEVRLANKSVCKSVQTEGAAGSTYTSYTYTFAVDDALVSYAFTLRTVRCENYDMPEQGVCKKDQDAFDVDGLVSDMISSIGQATK